MQLGNLAIIVALVMSALSGGAFLITALGRKNAFDLGRKAFYIQLAAVTFALGYLWYLFFTHDYSIKYVYEYSSDNLPFFYLLSSLWAGQDGTYLLWLFFSTLFGIIILKKARQYTSVAMAFFAVVNFFLLIMLLVASPFRKLDFAAADGAGLNPLLQDPWMVVHPPVIFVAFAMAGIVFAVIMAAMIKKDYSNWLKLSFPLVGITSLALALANVLGGYWAYKTLGWGGYWAWDPVENTSFIPWVVSLGLIHGLLIEKKSGALRRTNLMLGAFVFLLTIYGTFLTRSGVLADFSVHSFTDLGTNSVLLTFISFYVVLTIIVFAFTGSKDRTGKPMNYDIFSREFVLFLGMILLTALGIIVLFWSSLPLLTKYLTANPRAAEPSTYNTFAFPFAIFISLFLTVAPYVIGWSQRVTGLQLKVLSSAAISLLAAGILLLLEYINLVIAVTLFIYLTVLLIYMQGSKEWKKMLLSTAFGFIGLIVALLFGVRQLEHLFFILAASIAASAQITVLSKMIPQKWELVGGHLSHFGYGLMILGILSSSVFDTSEKIVIPRNGTASAYQYDITYTGMSSTIMAENNELILNVDDNGRTFDARPHYFFSSRVDGIMKRPHIKKSIPFDLYLSPQDVQELPQSGGLSLKKGENTKVGDYDIRFTGFEMGSHGSSSEMTVGAKLEVTLDDVTQTVTPVMISGERGMISEATPLFEGSDFDISIDRIDATSGMVFLSIPGLAESSPPDRLVLDVSVKPGINLLWLGTIIIFIGMFISIKLRLSK